MSLHATGPFEVKIDPQPPDEKGGGAAIGRMFLDKRFHIDLEAGHAVSAHPRRVLHCL